MSPSLFSRIVISSEARILCHSRSSGRCQETKTGNMLSRLPSGIAIYTPRRLYILMRRTTISHFSFKMSDMPQGRSLKAGIRGLKRLVTYMPLSGIAFYTLRRFYILMRRTTISHFAFRISHFSFGLTLIPSHQSPPLFPTPSLEVLLYSFLPVYRVSFYEMVTEVIHCLKIFLNPFLIT